MVVSVRRKVSKSWYSRHDFYLLQSDREQRKNPAMAWIKNSFRNTEEMLQWAYNKIKEETTQEIRISNRLVSLKRNLSESTSSLRSLQRKIRVSLQGTSKRRKVSVRNLKQYVRRIQPTMEAGKEALAPTSLVTTLQASSSMEEAEVSSLNKETAMSLEQDAAGSALEPEVVRVRRSKTKGTTVVQVSNAVMKVIQTLIPRILARASLSALKRKNIEPLNAEQTFFWTVEVIKHLINHDVRILQEVVNILHQYLYICEYETNHLLISAQISARKGDRFRQLVNRYVKRLFPSKEKMDTAKHTLQNFMIQQLGISNNLLGASGLAHNPTTAYAEADIDKSFQFLFDFYLNEMKIIPLPDGTLRVIIIITFDGTASRGQTVPYTCYGMKPVLKLNDVVVDPDAERLEKEAWEGRSQSLANQMLLGMYKGKDNKDVVLHNFKSSMNRVREINHGINHRFNVQTEDGMKVVEPLCGVCADAKAIAASCGSSNGKDICFICYSPHGHLNDMHTACDRCRNRTDKVIDKCPHRQVFKRSHLPPIEVPEGYRVVPNDDPFPLNSDVETLTAEQSKLCCQYHKLQVDSRHENRMNTLRNLAQTIGVSLYYKTLEDGTTQSDGHIDDVGESSLKYQLSRRYDAVDYDGLSVAQLRDKLKVALQHELNLTTYELAHMVHLLDPNDIIICTLHGFARTFEHFFHRLLKGVMGRLNNDSPSGQNAIIAALDKYIKELIKSYKSYVVCKNKSGDRCDLSSLNFGDYDMISKHFLDFLKICYPTMAEQSVAPWYEQQQQQQGGGGRAIVKQHCFQSWVSMWTVFVDVWEQVRYMGEWDAMRRNRLDDVIQVMYVQYGRMWPLKEMTQYLHIMYSGHLVSMIERFGSIHRLNNEGWEHLLSHVKRFVHDKSNNGVTGMPLAAAVVVEGTLDIMYTMNHNETVVAGGEGPMNARFTAFKQQYDENQRQHPETHYWHNISLLANKASCNVYDTENFSDETNSFIS